MSNIELIKEYKAGNFALRDKIIESNSGLVKKIALRYAIDKDNDLDDCIQEGYMGLMIALDKYDPDIGYEFSTYASWWIRQKIIRYCHNYSRSVRLTSYIYGEINKIKKK